MKEKSCTGNGIEGSIIPTFHTHTHKKNTKETN